MNNKIVQLLYQMFVKRGFATLRFNFRGVGKSQGVFDNGIGELSDAASALTGVVAAWSRYSLSELLKSAEFLPIAT